jgi:uncharacterized membrane protein
MSTKLSKEFIQEWTSGWRRRTLGTLAAVLLIVGGALMLGPPLASASGYVAGFCIRVGLLLGALWLALPQIFALYNKYPRWVWIGLIVAAVALFFSPAIIQILIPVVVVAALLYYLGYLKI